MKRILFVLLAVVVLSALVVVPVVAAENNGMAGNSGVGHLYLFEKDPSDWSIVEDGAWGKLTYKGDVEEFTCVFNGHELTPYEDYTLIRYKDPWPGVGSVYLAKGTANENGDVHLSWTEPKGLGLLDDDNEGYKIWLVLSGDINTDCSWNGWHPTEYLFEYQLLGI